MNTTKKRRRPRICLYGFLVPFLLFLTAVKGDEDEEKHDGSTEEESGYSSSSSSNNNKSNSSYNNNNNRSSSSNSNSKKGFQNVSPFCTQHYIEVNGVWITCDTPGAYYYGGSAYRNSEVCKTGDKAKLSIGFYIPSTFENQTLGLQIESGVYDSFQTVGVFSSICQNENLTLTSSYGSEEGCPSTGYYQIYTTFQMPSIGDSSLHYTPDIKLSFVNSDGERIGCATTGTIAEHQYQDRRATKGLIALGLGLFVFLIVFGLLLHLSHRRKKRLETVFENRRQSYQYFRTLPNGQVVPMPGAKAVAVRKPIVRVSDEAMNISNPAYNETHLPTRPII